MLSGTRVAVLLIVLVAVNISFVSGSDDPTAAKIPLVVSTNWLAEHYDDSNLIVIHIGPGDSYEEGHLVGARKGSLRSLIHETETGLRDEMLAPDAIGEELAKLGIKPDSRVVVYFSNEMASWAVARYVVTLEYAGFEGRVAYLDGGLPKWIAEERPVITDEAKFEPSSLTVVTVTDLIVDSDWVKERLGKPHVAIIDGRPEEGYTGLAGHWDRLGHVPGARNIPFFTVMAEEPPYLLKSRDQIAKMFVDAGADPGDTVVVYCGTGLWAAQPYLAAKYAGYETRLYDGSFQDWAAIESMPIEVSGSSASQGE